MNRYQKVNAAFRARLEAGYESKTVHLTARGIEPRFPAELWWCTTCGEPTTEDPCQFCGHQVARYSVVPASAPDDRSPER